jgi:hypothetical protein
LVLTRSSFRQAEQRARLAAPLALLAGAVLFLAITAVGRSSFGSDYARISRYVSLTVAMLLPALAVAVNAIATRWRGFLPVAVVVLVVGIPSNLHGVSGAQVPLNPLYSRIKQAILAVPRDPLAKKVPRALRPEQLSSRDVTVGWLLDGVAQHRLPRPPFTILDLLTSSNFRLSLYQSDDPAPTTVCTTLHGPVLLNLRPGETLGVYDNPIALIPAVLPYLVGPGLVFVPDEGHSVTVLRQIRKVEISPYDRRRPPRICTGPGMPKPTPGVDRSTTTTTVP